MSHPHISTQLSPASHPLSVRPPAVPRLSPEERSWRLIERSLLVAGFILLIISAAARVRGELFSRLAIWRMASHHAEPSSTVKPERARTLWGMDVSLWSDQRIAAYKASLAEHVDPPLAVLHIPRIHLDVPVLEGTDDLVLNRGLGRIAGTAQIGTSGNVALAGHRDGFFRGLKDISVGDEIQLETPSVTQSFRVDSFEIVDPSNVSVLRDTARPALTLVTCYPFYFVGHAPKRFIVHASLAGRSAAIGANLSVGNPNKENTP